MPVSVGLGWKIFGVDCGGGYFFSGELRTLFVVVQDQDFDADVVGFGRAEFGHGHAEAGVSVYVDHEGFGLGEFGADSRWEAETHGAETAGGDYCPGVPPSVVLRAHVVSEEWKWEV